MLGRIVRFKKLSSATQKRCKKFCYAGAIVPRADYLFSVRPSAIVWLEFCVSGHKRILEITTEILNIVSNNCKYGSCGFCFDFSFHLVSTLNVTRFCGCV
jgi:hypothetical protein